MKLTKKHIAWFFELGHKIRNRADLEVTNEDMQGFEEEFDSLVHDLGEYGGKYPDVLDDIGFGIRYSSAADFDARLRDLWQDIPARLKPARRTIVRAADEIYVNLIIGD